MDAIGGQEMLMPVLHPAEIWQRSGRYGIDELFKLQDRVGRDLVLAMTHEEIIAFHARARDPLLPRPAADLVPHPDQGAGRAAPQGGVLRTREFTMKDSYTLDRDEAGLDDGYALHEVAYDAHLRPLRAATSTRSSRDVGMMGGFGAHEYMAPSPAGEDRRRCATAATTPPTSRWPSRSRARVDPPHGAGRGGGRDAGRRDDRGLAEFLGIDERLTAKAVIVVPEDDRAGWCSRSCAAITVCTS